MHATYIFYANSIEGLKEDIKIVEIDFKHAYNKVLKLIYQGKTSDHAFDDSDNFLGRGGWE